MNASKNVWYLIAFLMLLWAVSQLLAAWRGQDVLQMDLTHRLAPPSARHLCGTDELGRDLLSRILAGCALTLSVSLIAFVSAFGLGAFIGALAGYFYQRWPDRVFNWVASMLFCLPFLLIVTAVMSVVEKNLFNAYIVITAIVWISPARLVRAAVFQAQSATFVLAQRALGRSEVYIFFRCLLPLSLRPAFVFTFKYFPEIIGLEAGLSFLGLGVQPPAPALGKMIFDSLNYLQAAWWYAFFPALALFMVVFLSNLLYTFLEYRTAHA